MALRTDGGDGMELAREHALLSRGGVSRSGLTLIELLVAIGLVSLLLGILVPVLFSARATASSAACLSRLASIMAGHEMVSASNGGVWANLYSHDTEHVTVDLGANSYGVGPFTQVFWWAGPFIGVLWSDGESGEALACPEIYRRDSGRYDSVPMRGAGDSYFYSAAMITSDRLWDPADRSARSDSERHRKRVSVGEVAHPSRKVVMFERADHHGDGSPVESAAVQNVNAGFADGHVARVAPREAQPALAVDWPAGTSLPSPLPFSASAWGHRGYDY